MAVYVLTLYDVNADNENKKARGKTGQNPVARQKENMGTLDK